MFFYLTKSLVVEPNNDKYVEIYKAIHHIASQVADSNHAMSGDYEVISHFREIFKEDLILGELFNDIYQNFATRGLPSELTFYIEVVIDNPSNRKEGNVYICQKKYLEYSTIDSLIKTRVICEDLYDAEFYKHILKWYINDKKSKLNYSFHNQGGGGKNIARTVKEELNKKHITICIVDTDKKYANYIPAKDSTYNECEPVGKDVEYYNFLPLDVHEIENLIPLNYIDVAFSNYTEDNVNDKKNKEAFDFLRQDAENILPYFDYKNGIRKNDELLNNQDYMTFAKLCYNQNPTMSKDFETHLQELNRKGQIYPPLIGGTGTIKMTLNLISNNNCPIPVLLDYQKKNWVRIGQNMLNWCVARNKEAIH
jgi:hypothetical protein